MKDKKGLIIISIESLIKENFRLKILSHRNFTEDIIEKKLKGKYIRKKDIIYDRPHHYCVSYIKKFYLEGYQIAYFTINSARMIEHYKNWLRLYNFPRPYCLENPVEEKSDSVNKQEIYDRIMKDFGYKYKKNIFIIDTEDWKNWWQTTAPKTRFLKSKVFRNKEFLLKDIEDIYKSQKKDDIPNFLMRFPRFILRIPRILIRKRKLKKNG